MRLSLGVSVYGRDVGTLVRDRNGAVRFLPNAGWLDDNQAPILGLAFLQDPAPRVAGTGLPLWFENLLPERDGFLRRRICAANRLRETDSPGLLSLLGHDLPGAVRVEGDVDAHPAADPESAPDAARRFSLAGMQLKFSMVQAGRRFSLPLAGDTGHWIVKLPGSNMPELPEVEHATMKWARALGFDVPENQVVAVADLELDPGDLRGLAGKALAVRRFDRTDADGRIHQEDFAQALEVNPLHKYSDGGPRRASYDLLARLIGDAIGPEARTEFARRIGFMIAAGDTDAHLKNFALLWPHGSRRPALAPLYDQVATIAWSHEFGWDGPTSPALALPLGGSRSLTDLNAARLERFAERAGDPALAGVVAETTRRAIEVWRAGRGATAPASMAAALQIHWKRVPLLRQTASA